MNRREVPIDWDALEIAVERNAPNTKSFVDLTTGQVVTIVAGDPEASLLERQVSENIRNFIRVEPASSREQYRWMERFVGSVADPALRERLVMSIDGKGAFRRFKDVLLAYPAERERWFAYRSELLHWHIHTWLEEHDLAGQHTPPWGAAAEPVELEAVEVSLPESTGEAPGESLRREARELIDNIPAIDLPSAIAFLQFLRERGGRALAPDVQDVKGDEDDEATAKQRIAG